MNPDTGEIKELLEGEEPPSPKWVTLNVGQEVVINGCRFRISYINAGKGRVTLEALPEAADHAR